MKKQMKKMGIRVFSTVLVLSAAVAPALADAWGCDPNQADTPCEYSEYGTWCFDGALHGYYDCTPYGVATGLCVWLTGG